MAVALGIERTKMWYMDRLIRTSKGVNLRMGDSKREMGASGIAIIDQSRIPNGSLDGSQS